MTLSDYKCICFRSWLLRRSLPSVHLSEYALWELHYESDYTPVSQIVGVNTAEWDALWAERIAIPGLYSYLNCPNSHIADWFQHLQPNRS